MGFLYRRDICRARAKMYLSIKNYIFAIISFRESERIIIFFKQFSRFFFFFIK